MTVKELIEKLKEFDEEFEVFIEDDGLAIEILNINQDSIKDSIYIEIYS